MKINPKDLPALCQLDRAVITAALEAFIVAHAAALSRPSTGRTNDRARERKANELARAEDLLAKLRAL